MSRPKKRFCVNGHDTEDVGRTPRGHCRVCQRELNREYARGIRRPKGPLVPWAPLEERLNAAGIPWNSRVSADSRRRYRRHGVPVLVADSLSVDLLHVHPTVIWGQSWYAEDD